MEKLSLLSVCLITMVKFNYAFGKQNINNYMLMRKLCLFNQLSQSKTKNSGHTGFVFKPTEHILFSFNCTSEFAQTK